MTLSTPGGRCSADFCQQQQAQRRGLGQHDHHGVAHRQSGGDLEAGDHQRGVPRQDGADNPQRFETGELQLVLTRRQDHAFGFSRDPGEVPKEVRQGGGLGPGLRESRCRCPGRSRSPGRQDASMVGDATERPLAPREVLGAPRSGKPRAQRPPPCRRRRHRHRHAADDMAPHDRPGDQSIVQRLDPSPVDEHPVITGLGDTGGVRGDLYRGHDDSRKLVACGGALSVTERVETVPIQQRRANERDCCLGE